MKKVLSLVLVIAMVLSSFSFAFAAKFEDVEGDYEEAVNVLSALGVIDGYEDGTYRPERIVTRAEMAKLIVQILGYGDLVAGSASNFADTQGHWADAWIALAAGRGLVIGTGDGNFTPDRQVSYDEAITMIIRALGYTDNSNELKNMTWPTNFKVKASELKLLDGIKLVAGGADRGGVAQLLFNALDAVLVTVTVDGDVTKLQDTIDGQREDRLLITRLATPDYDYEVTTDKLDPDNKNYAGNIVDLAPYMFQNLDVYLNNNDEVVYIKGTNSLVIEGVVDDISGLVVEVEDANKKIQKATLEDDDIDADTVFENGALKESDIKIGDLEDTDTITIVADDDNNNGKIDKGEVLGFVTTIQTKVIRVEQEYVAGKDKIDGLLLPDKVTVKGEVDALEDIEIDDIVVEYLSEDEEVTTLVVTREVVEGKATRITDADTFYIDGVKYEIADMSIIGDGNVKLGDEGTFFLNQYGEVVDFDGSELGPKDYAVVIGLASGNTDDDRFTGDLSVDEYPSLKLATQAGKEIVYDIEVDVTKAGIVDESAEDEDGKFLVKNGTGDKLVVDTSVVDEDYLIKYKLNKDDRISEIEVIRDLESANTYKEIDLDKAANTLVSDAIIFDAGDDYAVVNENKLPTKVDAYVVRNSSGNITVLVAKDGEVDSAAEEVFVYVRYVDDAYNNGDEVQIATIFTEGAKAEVYTTEDDTFKSFKEGVYAVEYDGEEIDSATRVAKADFYGEADTVNARGNMIEVDGEWLSMSENGTVIEVKEIKANGEYKYDSIADLYDIIKGQTLIEVFMNEDDDIDLIVIIPDGKDNREPEAPVVNKAALNAAIVTANAKVEANYTVASWNALEAALVVAEAVNDDNSATQAEVNDAYADLVDAIEALVLLAGEDNVLEAEYVATAFGNRVQFDMPDGQTTITSAKVNGVNLSTTKFSVSNNTQGRVIVTNSADVVEVVIGGQTYSVEVQ